MSSSLRNVVIIFVLVVASIAAGIKGFVHHKYKENLNNALRMAEGVALIRYRDFSTSLLSGSLAIEGITVSSPYLPSDLSIDKVEIQTPGPVFMITAAKSLQGKEFPEKMGLRVTGFDVGLGEGLGTWIDSLVKRIDPVYRPYQNLCGGRTVFGPSDWKEMGYKSLSMDANLSYQFDSSSKTFNIQTDEQIEGMGRVKFSMSISGPSSPSMMGFIQGKPPTVGNLSVNIQDTGYTAREVSFCAGLDKMEKSAYIKAKKQQSDKFYFASWGFAPGAGIREALADYLTQPGSIQITAHPSADFNPVMLQSYSGKDLARLLNIELMVNNKSIDDLSFTLPDRAFSEDLQARLEAQMDMSKFVGGVTAPGSDESTFKKTEIPEFKQREIIKPKYYVVELAGIEKYRGERVRITTHSGQEREGILISTDSSTLFVERRVHSGKFTMQVARNDVKTIEAWLARK